MISIDELKFDEKGLIPAIIVDATNKKVLTLAYMNRESLEISIKEGKTCFWSRSRNELWRKGADTIVLDSQEYAVGFYRKIGFTECSGVFQIDGIPHIKMELRRG